MIKNRRPFGMLYGPVRAALQDLLSYLLEDEERSYRDAPEDDHVYLKLRAVRTWIDRMPEPAPKFELGKVYMTPGAQEKIPLVEMLIGLGRHATGDWGDC